MKDITEIEKKLKQLQPARPSDILRKKCLFDLAAKSDLSALATKSDLAGPVIKSESQTGITSRLLLAIAASLLLFLTVWSSYENSKLEKLVPWQKILESMLYTRENKPLWHQRTQVMSALLTRNKGY